MVTIHKNTKSKLNVFIKHDGGGENKETLSISQRFKFSKV